MGGPYWMYDLETQHAMYDEPPPEPRRRRPSALVDNPACQCCPHTEMSDLERDDLAREVWDGCPESGCLWALCPVCEEAR